MLLRKVLIKGGLILTNHRLLFIAFLPSAADLQRMRATEARKERQELNGANVAPDSSDEHEESGVDGNPVLKKGPAIEHRAGKLVPKRRVWVELRAASVSFYPSSDRLYKPLESIALGDVQEVHPVDWRRPNSVHFRAHGRERDLEFGTEEGAIAWRREMDGALWKLRHTAEKIHIQLPLARVKCVEHHSFLNFATCTQVFVQDDPKENDDAASTVSTSTSSGTDLAGGVPTSIGSQGEKEKDTVEITFGLLHSRASFEHSLHAAAKLPVEWRQRVGWSTALSATSRPIISVDGPMAQDHVEHPPTPGEEHATPIVKLPANLEGADQVTAQKAARFIKEFSLRTDIDLKGEK